MAKEQLAKPAKESKTSLVRYSVDPGEWMGQRSSAEKAKGAGWEWVARRRAGRAAHAGHATGSHTSTLFHHPATPPISST